MQQRVDRGRRALAKVLLGGDDVENAAVSAQPQPVVGLSTVRCVALAAKQPPDAAASNHHEKNRQCDCSCKHCNYCCERKDVHDAILKCEKHAFPLDGKSPRPLTAGASWQSEVVRS